MSQIQPEMITLNPDIVGRVQPSDVAVQDREPEEEETAPEGGSEKANKPKRKSKYKQPTKVNELDSAKFICIDFLV